MRIADAPGYIFFGLITLSLGLIVIVLGMRAEFSLAKGTNKNMRRYDGYASSALGLGMAYLGGSLMYCAWPVQHPARPTSHDPIVSLPVPPTYCIIGAFVLGGTSIVGMYAMRSNYLAIAGMMGAFSIFSWTGSVLMALHKQSLVWPTHVVWVCMVMFIASIITYVAIGAHRERANGHEDVKASLCS